MQFCRAVVEANSQIHIPGINSGSAPATSWLQPLVRTAVEITLADQSHNETLKHCAGVQLQCSVRIACKTLSAGGNYGTYVRLAAATKRR